MIVQQSLHRSFAKHQAVEAEMSSELLFGLGLLLVLTGLALAFLAAVATGVRGRARGGAVVLVGPIPIMFGTDKRIVSLLAAGSFALLDRPY